MLAPLLVLLPAFGTGYYLPGRVGTTPACSASTSATMMANAVTNGLNGSKFCLNVRLCIRSERRKEFLKCIKNNQKGTLTTEPLALEYVWGEDTSTPNVFHFYEKYEGAAGFEAHQATAHFAAWEAFASSEPSPFTEPPRVEFYEEFF